MCVCVSYLAAGAHQVVAPVLHLRPQLLLPHLCVCEKEREREEGREREREREGGEELASKRERELEKWITP